MSFLLFLEKAGTGNPQVTAGPFLALPFSMESLYVVSAFKGINCYVFCYIETLPRVSWLAIAISNIYRRGAQF
jgi:hypothetical protein